MLLVRYIYLILSLQIQLQNILPLEISSEPLLAEGIVEETVVEESIESKSIHSSSQKNIDITKQDSESNIIEEK
jgi:hypothetical protein